MNIMYDKNFLESVSYFNRISGTAYHQSQLVAVTIPATTTPVIYILAHIQRANYRGISTDLDILSKARLARDKC